MQCVPIYCLADVERASPKGAVAQDAASTVPPILSLDDITSMEDITSLENLQLDDLKTGVGRGAAESSPDRVRNFRRTVKAMSTQVTPQTSPLGELIVTHLEFTFLYM